MTAAARAGRRPPEVTERALRHLTDAGFVRQEGVDADARWTVTPLGAGLAAAGFPKPMSRVTARVLLHAVVDRAAAYNARGDGLVVIAEVRVVGSYLDPAAERLGDLDIWLIVRERHPSGAARKPPDPREQRGASEVSRSVWEEVLGAIRGDSGYVHVHLDAVDCSPERWVTVYTEDLGSVTTA